MKKMKLHFVLFCAAITVSLMWINEASAQTTKSSRGNIATSSDFVKKSQQPSQHFKVATARVNPQLISGRKIEYVKHDPNAIRKCTPRPGHDPNSIKKDELDNLPAPTREFILNHPEKYTIVH